MKVFHVRWALGKSGLQVAVDATKIQYKTFIYPSKDRRKKLDGLVYLPKPLKFVLRKTTNLVADFEIREDAIKRTPIADSKTYLRMKDVFDHRANLGASQTYETIVHEIEAKGFFQHKSSTVKEKGSIEEFMRVCFLDIMLSMDSSGYVADHQSGFGTGGIGFAIIDKDGSILKTRSADHRLAAAQIVNMQGPFPLRVAGCHKQWMDSHRIGSVRDLRALRNQIRNVEHENS